MSSPREGGEVEHRVGILTFSKKENYSNPHPRAKNNGQKYGLLLFCSLQFKDQMIKITTAWGQVTVKFVRVAQPPSLRARH